MCTLNQLKKKLHFNKLIQFLNQYPYIVFYHSNKGNALRHDLVKSNTSLAILFLVNSARIRDLTKAKQESHQKHNFVTRVDRVSTQNNSGQKGFFDGLEGALSSTIKQGAHPKSLKCYGEKNKRNTNSLTWVASGGAMGSTFLVGCKSLEAMQLVIRDNQPQSKAKNEKSVDLVCLGAIYNHSFRDHLDCLRLSEMNLSIKAAQEKLLHTLGSVQSKLLSALLKAQNHMHLCLMAASKSTKLGR